MTRTLVPADDPILRTKASRVLDFDFRLKELIADMWETMRAHKGLGLAAPQIGVSKRVLVAEYKGQQIRLVNPVITRRVTNLVSSTEGCLSLPGVRVRVLRAKEIQVLAYSPIGKPVVLRAAGQLSCILQHEIDHLDGILITDREKEFNAA